MMDPLGEILLNAMGVAIVTFFGVRLAKVAIAAAALLVGN